MTRIRTEISVNYDMQHTVMELMLEKYIKENVPMNLWSILVSQYLIFRKIMIFLNDYHKHMIRGLLKIAIKICVSANLIAVLEQA